MSDNSELVPHVFEGELVEEDAWKLVVWRHFVRYEEGHPTLDDALGSASGTEEYGTGSTEAIIRPDGTRIEGEEYRELLWSWEKAHVR